MRLLFELSGEHPTLPRAEALAALEAEGVSVRSMTLGPATFEVEALRPPPRSWRRVALCRYVGTVLASGGLDRLLEAGRRVTCAHRTIRVRAPGLLGAARLHAERDLGAALLSHGGRADLERPDVDFRVVGDGTLRLVRVLHVVDRASLERSHRARRELGQPVSLHPKFARALVNLSRCPPGGRLLDPFCGTGGILLEATRVGAHAYGGDISAAMVLRSRRTLDETRRSARLRVADIAEWMGMQARFDAVATDPPYGRSATTGGEDRGSLYDRAFATIAKVLRPGGFAAVALPSEASIRMGEKHLELVETHSVRVHRSLTRRFCAFRAAAR